MAIIWQICSAVNVAGQPGRGLSANRALIASRKRLGFWVVLNKARRA
jgi:hypothetical protein